jgi:cullin 1
MPQPRQVRVSSALNNFPSAPDKDDIDKTWDYLKSGIDRIHDNLQDGMDLKTYMGIYT